MKRITISTDLATRYDSDDARLYAGALSEIREMIEAALAAGAHAVEILHPEGFVIEAG